MLVAEAKQVWETKKRHLGGSPKKKHWYLFTKKYLQGHEEYLTKYFPKGFVAIN